MRAIGMFIFGGSATFGAESAGYKVDKILEMTNDMKELNAYHFAKNRPDVPIILPQQWDNEQYLKSLSNEKYDLLFANCPCSSLSQINRNASVDGKNNVHFYTLFRALSLIQPKTFVIENAPTLVKLGFPIIKDMIDKLSDNYKFTIIRDYAGNHDVPMKRMRTLLVGWNRKYFNDIPLLEMNHKPITTIKDTIGDLYNKPVGSESIFNHVPVEDREWSQYEHLFNLVKPNVSSLMTFIDTWEDIKHNFDDKDAAGIIKEKTKVENNKRLWDKSPYRADENGVAPSMTSVTQLIHPIHDRQWTIREYARLMGYPDSFEFYPNECQVPIIQCIAQGVPANFINYIATEIKEALNNNRSLLKNSDDKLLCFQHHTSKMFRVYDRNEFDNLNELDYVLKDKSFHKLEK